MQLYQVTTDRGLNLPEGLEPEFMFQLEGGNTLIVQDVKGEVYVKKGKAWLKAQPFEFPKPKKAEPEIKLELPAATGVEPAAEPAAKPAPKKGRKVPAKEPA